MIFSHMEKAFRNPIKAGSYAALILRGYYYKIKYATLRKNVEIGRKLKVRKKLSIKGPGKVKMGDNVHIDGTSNPVTPWTTSKEAEIIIGNNVFLNGTRFGCAKKIEIGDNCIIGDCRILDTDFHSIQPARRNDPTLINSAPVNIGKNVWIALGCVILQGVKIGDNSTISAQSVVYDDVPEYCVYGGNPAHFIKRVPCDSQ
jgi:acetyltransferase-like isoleucine patch superfamily enzyme